MKRSIAARLSALFIGLIMLSTVLNLLLNHFLLERYYTHSLVRTMTGAYEKIDEHIPDGVVDQTYFETDFRELSSANNLELVVVDAGFAPILSTSSDNNPGSGSGQDADDGHSQDAGQFGGPGDAFLMYGRLFGYYTSIDKSDSLVLEENEKYTIQRNRDDMNNIEYLEMWGELGCGYRFLMRIPQASIRASAGISSRFMLFISLAVSALSVVVIMFVSRRFTRPIRELTELSGRMANLDFDARYTSGGEDEIGQLGEHFNRMSEELEKTVSQLKTANIELKRDLEKRTEIDEMRKEFLSNVSHELKTPLALIQGYAEGLKECVNDDPAGREFYCDVIIDEAGKMNRLVQKLMTLNQLESGNDQAQMERMDLAELIRGKVQSTQILAQPKDVTMVCRCPEHLHVWGDPFRVEEVLTNYISNALNHVSGEKRIEVRTEVLGGKVRTSVYNTGDPIPEESLDQIWVKFYKVDKARTREYGGSGVGLSIVKAIMDSMQQGYGVQNTADGVEFWFDLENADGERNAAES